MNYDQSFYDTCDQFESPSVRVVVSLSSGNASAVVAERAIQLYGVERVALVFADTLIEHESNYAFLAQLEQRWGKPITRLTDGRDPYGVAEDEGIIPNDMLATCSYELKIRLVQEYVDQLQADGYLVIVAVGYDIKDTRPRPKKPEGRLSETRKRWAARKVIVWYPLLEREPLQFYKRGGIPVVLDASAEVRAWGIQGSIMYEQGYSHANCSGVCVKQGLRDWRRTLIHNKAMFLKVERWERKMRAYMVLRQFVRFAAAIYTQNWIAAAKVNLKLYSMLDSGKTLEELRLETEQADGDQLRMFEILDDVSDRVCGVECMAA